MHGPGAPSFPTHDARFAPHAHFALPPHRTPPPARTPAAVWVLLSVALMLVLGTCGGAAAAVAVLGSSDERGGVILGAQVPRATEASLWTQGVLGADEVLVAYYDATVSLDGSDVALITSERVLTARGGEIASLRLADVNAVEHRKEPLVGDVVEVVADGARRLRIEVAPFNGGASFVSALEDAWRRRRPGARVRRR